MVSRFLNFIGYKILDAKLYEQALFRDITPEIAEVKNTMITDEFITSVKDLPGVSAAALRDYHGKIIEAALEAHSQKLPQ